MQSIEISFCILKAVVMNTLWRGKRKAKAYIIALVFSLLTTPGARSLERSRLLRRFAPQEHESHSGWAEGHDAYFGADYYPEDYSSVQIERDAETMQRARFNVVRVLDSNWARIEPSDGHFSFTWLDSVLDILGRHNIQVILGVPSYAPPYWLLHLHPEILLIDQNGRQYRSGGLGFINILDPLYRTHVHRLDEEMARHYANDKRVIGWQIDNERGIFGSACYNPSCLAGFHDYLRRKFQTIAEVNRRWGTVSYGHEFTSFDEIPLDWQPVGDENHQSSLQFEARRFFSVAQTDFLREQAEVFRRVAPGQFITHNAAFPSLACDYFQLATPLDFIGFDNYPDLGSHRSQSLNLDLVRGYNRGNPFLILEEAAGAPGPSTFTDAEPPPGQLRLWAYQTIAHGADGVLFFRWRTARSGSEEFWQGLLDPAGDDTRRFPEVSVMASEVNRLAPLLLRTRPAPRVAILYSWDSWSAMEVGDAKPNYLRHIIDWHAALKAEGVDVDVISPDSDMGRYSLIVAPDLYLVTSTLLQKLQRFVSEGGIFVTGPRTGTKDQDNRFFLESRWPDILSTLAGIQISEATVLRGPKPSDDGADYTPAATTSIASAAADWPGTYSASEWADILEPHGAQTLFKYSKDYFAGKPAVTLNNAGKGQVIYLGSTFDQQFRHMLVDQLLRKLPSVTWFHGQPGIEVNERRGPNDHLVFVLNFSSEPKTISIPGKWQDALTGNAVIGDVLVDSLNLRVLYNSDSQ